MTDEAAANVMKGWLAEFHKTIEELLAEFHKTIEELGVPTDRIYNAEQTGFYYTKLPNRVYVSKANRNDTKGCKQMKSKDRITVMVCIAASGSKVPLAVVGRSKQPAAFKYELPQGRGPPIRYANQNDAWFGQKVTIWSIHQVFWPWHVSQHGDVWAILLLNNCSADTDLEESHLPRKLKIIFFSRRISPVDSNQLIWE